jgi:competence protein ComGC
MNFKQDELISSGYVFYTLGITVTLLVIAYLMLLFCKKNLIAKFSQQLKTDEKSQVIKLSPKVTLYIIDRNDYDLVIVESNQNVSVTHVSKNPNSKIFSDGQSVNE